MLNNEAKKMLKAKLECLKRETSGTNHDCNMQLCDGCDLNYEQGNMGEQKEALETSIKALEKEGENKIMHYHEHLGKQAISFLRNLMKRYGADKHQMPEYFEDYFFEMLKSYPSLNGLLLSDMKEGIAKNE